jgi:flagellar basal body-associated protein FliL
LLYNSVEVQIANRLPKISPASAKKETRLKTGSKGDISTSLLSTSGVTVNKAAHDIWEDNFRESGLLDTEQVKDIIIEILNKGSIKAYKEEFDGTANLANLKQQLKEKINALTVPLGKKAKLVDLNQLNLFEQEEENWENEDNECDMPF